VSTWRVSRQPDRIDPVRPAQQRQPHYGCPRCHRAAAPGSVLSHLTAVLVAEDHLLCRAAKAVITNPLRHICPDVEPMAGMQVRSADSASQDLDSNLPLTGLGLGPL